MLCNYFIFQAVVPIPKIESQNVSNLEKEHFLGFPILILCPKSTVCTVIAKEKYFVFIHYFILLFTVYTYIY